MKLLMATLVILTAAFALAACAALRDASRYW